MPNKNQMIANSLSLIENIKVVRGIISSGNFDAKLFDSINGDDKALESLCQKDIVFDLLDEAGRTALRREIMNRLTENEIATYGKLRDYLSLTFRPLHSAAVAADLNAKERVEAVENVGAITQELKNLIPSATIDNSTFSANYVEKSVESLGKVVDFFVRIAPVLARVMADADEEENSSKPADPSLPTIDTTTGAEQAPAEPLPQDPPMNDPDHQLFVNPAEDDENAMQAIADMATRNTSVNECIEGFIRADEKCPNTMQSLGYETVESITGTIEKIADIKAKFKDACSKVYDTFPVDTCVSEELVKATDLTMKAYSAVTDLANSCNVLIARLDETSEGLVNALQTLEREASK